jgi:hypothetical protein
MCILFQGFVCILKNDTLSFLNMRTVLHWDLIQAGRGQGYLNAWYFKGWGAGEAQSV